MAGGEESYFEAAGGGAGAICHEDFPFTYTYMVPRSNQLVSSRIDQRSHIVGGVSQDSGVASATTIAGFTSYEGRSIPSQIQPRRKTHDGGAPVRPVERC